MHSGAVSSSHQPAASLRAVMALLVGVAGLAFCLTLLFLGMRAVMDVGGSCADGGPYVSSQSCPNGTPLALLLGIFGIFGFGALAMFGGITIGGRYGGLVLLAWPALFLSLGWNFFEYGIRSSAERGPDLGSLICAVVFAIIGAGPLLAFLPALPGRTAGRDAIGLRRLAADLRARRGQLTAAEGGSTAVDTLFGRRPAAGGGTPRGERSDLTSRLERLAALHTAGSLTDAEFDEAKRRVIAEVAAGR